MFFPVEQDSSTAKMYFILRSNSTMPSLLTKMNLLVELE